jgi:hypothetical protein
LHVENKCLISVADNYRCDAAEDGSAYTELPQFIQMTDNSDGTYSADFTIFRDGDVTTSVVLARQGGLHAEYFNNAFLSDSPTLTKVDHKLDFNWSDGMLTPEAGDFVSVHWYGKLLAPKSEPYTFVLKGDEGFRLYLDGQLLIDRWDSCCDEMQATA